MSPVRLNGSTSGYSELSAPAVAGNNSIALPTGNGSANQFLKNGATAGALAFGTTTEDASGNLAFNSGYGSAAVAYGCRAWVNFNGTGTVAIRASGNVSSITDNGVGNYTVNFTTAMVTSSYAMCATAQSDGVANNGFVLPGVFTTTSANAITMSGGTAGGTLYDCPVVSVAIFR